MLAVGNGCELFAIGQADRSRQEPIVIRADGPRKTAEKKNQAGYSKKNRVETAALKLQRPMQSQAKQKAGGESGSHAMRRNVNKSVQDKKENSDKRRRQTQPLIRADLQWKEFFRGKKRRSHEAENQSGPADFTAEPKPVTLRMKGPIVGQEKLPEKLRRRTRNFQDQSRTRAKCELVEKRPERSSAAKIARNPEFRARADETVPKRIPQKAGEWSGATGKKKKARASRGGGTLAKSKLTEPKCAASNQKITIPAREKLRMIAATTSARARKPHDPALPCFAKNRPGDKAGARWQ